MSVDSEKIKRAITSFNNQITRITKIRDSFPVGNKIYENLEVEIKKLVEDRDKLKHISFHLTDSVLKTQAKTEKVGIKENALAVLGKADEVEESPDSEIIRILKKLEKNTISKKMTFCISLCASIIGLAIGIAIGYFLP